MDETVNQVQTGAEQEERTFTQAEVDKIVAERLSRERAKYADYDALSKKAAKVDELVETSKTMRTELDALKSAETLRSMREKVSKETGVPMDLLTAKTEEECTEQAKRIMEFAKPGAYPQLQDGGEPKSGPSKQTTREQFAKWFDAQSK